LHFQRQGEQAATMQEGLLQSTATIVPLDEAVCQHIRQALSFTGGKISGKDGAAALLDIHPNTLRNRMQKLGIQFGRTPNP
jgi:transcriptional regulator with GAF, ATPase, and Fis domain